MVKKVAIVCVLVLMMGVILAGCSSGIAGRYVFSRAEDPQGLLDEDAVSLYLELREDGSGVMGGNSHIPEQDCICSDGRSFYVIEEEGIKMRYGIYHIEGDMFVLDTNFGVVIYLEKE